MIPTLVLDNRILIRVRGDGTYVGRGPANDFVIEDPCVSRRHAFFWPEEDSLWVRDTNSSNGVYVNGIRVVENAPVPVGSQVIIGNTLLVAALVPETERVPAPGTAEAVPPEAADREELLRLWEGLIAEVPRGQGRITWLSARTGTPPRVCDAVRQARNRVAHGEKVSSTEVHQATVAARMLDQLMEVGS